jgi:adenine-specific DNA-methyltransferase
MNKKLQLVNRKTQVNISPYYDPRADVVLFTGNCLDLLAIMPDKVAKLIVTSPPYNLGKPYERRTKLENYLKEQSRVIAECVRILHPEGSICWQVGNYVQESEVFPLDTLLFPIFKNHKLKLRNRIIWHFGHGLHCSRRFSGRYETIIWFTKGDNYTFDLDAVRIPQKYPGKKYYKGPKKGQFSCHPKGKNPGDLWTIPNVKHNHPEKTSHPCQFPVELIERLVLSMTKEGDLVFDPFMGVGTTAVAAILHKRKAAGAEIIPEYVEIAISRVLSAVQGEIVTRPMDKPIYEPPHTSKLTHRPVSFGA